MFLHASFRQTIAHINDSSNFDSSFEVKYIPTSEQHIANRCCTISQCDREALLRFVEEFEALQIYSNSAKSTPKKSPPPLTTHNQEKTLKHDRIIAGNTTTSPTQSPVDLPVLRDYVDPNLWSSSGDYLMEQRSNSNSSNTTRSNSPVLLRSSMGCKPLTCCDHGIDPDDDIELMASNANSSADLLLDLHPPLLPSFNITPPSKQTRGPAHELARFLRGSFHIKRAKITHLRRSLSETENLRNHRDFEASSPVSKRASVRAKKKILEDTTNRNNGNSTNTRTSPSSQNTASSPFRRVWEQSSLRSPRADKYMLSPLQTKGNNSVQRCSTFMIATDNDRSPHAYVGLDKGDAKRPTRLFSEKMTNPKTSRVSTWALSFEHLLEDAAGLATFAEFLKMEFSAENIYFWTSCERYRTTDNLSERQAQAKQIFGKYISNGCSEPVNLDAHTRNVSEQALQDADRNLFAKAQKQIFHLMKFDSYQRFIRSDLYKNCQKAEEKGQPLPYGAENLDALLKTNFLQSASPKLKKSASNAEDRRRKILLPWHRKTRSKSRDRMDMLLNATTPPPICHRETSHGSASALNTLLPSAKFGTLSSAKSSEDCYTQTLRSSLPSSLKSLSSGCSLCRVKFSDDATTIVQIKPNETVGQLIERLLEKRGLRYQQYDVIIKSRSKSVDLQTSSLDIAGEEVLIDQRVTFKIYLPDPKVISVKSKPKKYLHEVIRPILQKYNYDPETVDVLRRDNMEKLDLSQLVTTADGQRLHVVLRKPNFMNTDNDYQNDNIALNYMKSKELASEFIARNTKNNFRNITMKSESNLDEISNKLYDDIREEQVRPESLSQLTDQYSLKSDDFGSNNSVFYDTTNSRKPSTSTRLRGKSLTSAQQQSADSDLNKPIIAKLKAGVKLQVTEIVAEKQDELLVSLKSRLDNQTSSSIAAQLKELPELYKNKENANETALNLRHIRANLSPINKNNNLNAGSITPPPVDRTQPMFPQKNNSPIPISGEERQEHASSTNTDETNAAYKGPPPLPPKPKVLPTKPSNWGANISD